MIFISFHIFTFIPKSLTRITYYQTKILTNFILLQFISMSITFIINYTWISFSTTKCVISLITIFLRIHSTQGKLGICLAPDKILLISSYILICTMLTPLILQVELLLIRIAPPSIDLCIEDSSMLGHVVRIPKLRTQMFLCFDFPPSIAIRTSSISSSTKGVHKYKLDPELVDWVGSR